MRRITVVGMIILGLVAVPLVVGAKAGDKPAKVAVCHIPDSGEPHEIVISEKALKAHVGDFDNEGHGDTLGECPDLAELPPANTPPVASVTITSSCALSCTFKFDGSASFDDEGDALTYQWKITGPDKTWSSTDPITFAPGFQDDTLVYEFTVSDGELTDTVSGTYQIP